MRFLSFLSFLKLFLFLRFAEGEGGAGGDAPAPSGDANAPSGDTPAPSGDANANAPSGDTNPLLQEIQTLRKEVEELVKFKQSASENAEFQKSVDSAKAEIAKVEQAFPEWNAAEQQRTAVEMAKLHTEGKLPDIYKGVSGAFLFWSERLKGNPQTVSGGGGYVPNEQEVALMKKAEEGAPLTMQERLKAMELIKAGY